MAKEDKVLLVDIARELNAIGLERVTEETLLLEGFTFDIHLPKAWKDIGDFYVSYQTNNPIKGLYKLHEVVYMGGK